MSRMSELHDDLSIIHTILLGQRKVAQIGLDRATARNDHENVLTIWQVRIECINGLLLEFEAAGVVWPGNVVSLDDRIDKFIETVKCGCEGDIHPEHGPNC